jgi:ligand-binding sensor domain-containing protein
MVRKYRYTPVIFSFLSLVVVPITLLSQQRLEFSHIYSEDGLSQSSVWSITQDYQGFMWFGTFDGLNRYDGYTFNIYKNEPSSPHSIDANSIGVIFEDSKRNLWIGTSEGLNLYDRTKDQFVRFTHSPRNPNIGTAVKAICEDKNGKIWVGGAHGISMVDVASRKLLRFNPGYSAKENKHFVYSLLFDKDDNLWAGTEYGLDYYNLKVKKFHTFFTNIQERDHNTIYQIMLDHSGLLWIAAGNGVFTHARGDTNITRVLPEINGRISYVYQTRDRAIFISTEHGLFVYNIAKKRIEEYYRKEKSSLGLSDGSLSCVYQDKNNDIWIGSFNGLNFTGNRSKFKRISDDTRDIKLKNPYICSVAEDNDHHVWIGTGKGIEVLDVSQGFVKQLTSLYPALDQINSAVLSITIIDKDNIRFAVWAKGIYDYNIRNKTLTKLVNEISTCSMPLVYHDRYGKAWLACESGLFYFDAKNNSFQEEDKLKNYNINYIQEDAKRGLWIGHSLGLIHYNTVTQIITPYKGNHNEKLNLPVNSISWVYEDKDGLTWVGTNAGLWVLADGVFESLWMKYGFPNHAIKSILEDDHNNLWLSASDGLYRFNKRTKIVVKFDVTDGVQGNEFVRKSARKLEDGTMVFGGTKGLNIFHPDSIKACSMLTDVVITDFKILNRPVAVDSVKLKTHISVAKEINLDYTDTEFSFEFVAINFSSSQKLKYAYKMEGYDKEWNYSGTRRFASYTNLPAGKEYIFKVKASNSDNVWSEEGASVSIYIRPPFWNTWWFRAILYVSIITGTYWAYRMRVHRLQTQRNNLIMQKRLLQEQVYQRTLDLHKANVILREQSEELKTQSDQLKEQSEEIAVINDVLKQDNTKLEHNVKELEEARVLQKWVSLAEFKALYPDNDSCYRFIEAQKWGDQYQCRKCGYKKYSPGGIEHSRRFEYSRRCTKCNYIETITSGTIFEGVKFPINKAFYLLFLITEGKRYTLKELADVVDLRPQTCWTFKKRVIERTKSKNLQKNKGGLSELILLS